MINVTVGEKFFTLERHEAQFLSDALLSALSNPTDKAIQGFSQRAGTLQVTTSPEEANFTGHMQHFSQQAPAIRTHTLTDC